MTDLPVRIDLGRPASRLVNRVREVAPEWYGQLPYHGWPHVDDAEKRAYILARRCRKHQVALDLDVVLIAIYGHDAFFGFDHRMCQVLDEYGQPRSFSSKEELAAMHTARELEKLGADRALIDKVVGCIMATHPAVDPVTPEQIVVRASDLGNLSGPFDEFRTNWEALRHESLLMTGEEIDEFAWARRSAGYLALFLWRKLYLTSDYYGADGSSAYHKSAVENILRLVGEVYVRYGLEPRVVAEIGPGSHPAILDSDVEEGDIYIGIDRQECVLPWALKETKARGLPLPVFMIPGEGAHLPLTDGLADIVYAINVALRHPEAVHPPEIQRVMKLGGKLIVRETYAPDGSAYSSESITNSIQRLCDCLSFGTALVCSPVIEFGSTGGFEIEFTKVSG